MIVEMGTIIASRTLTCEDGQIVLVELGLPQPYPNGQDFFCPFRISGFGDGTIRHALGVDSLQSIFLALDKLRSILQALSTTIGSPLKWVDEGENFGFPERWSS